MNTTLAPRDIRFDVDGRHEVSGLVVRPADARVLYVLGHGAGAGMRHPFLEVMARVLAARGVATFRYQFPYMERGSRRPDHRATLLSTVRAAIVTAVRTVPGLPLVAGGKSMGGRMTSLALSETPMAEVAGLVFLGFPLHQPGKPSADRGTHLAHVSVPMLFLQGTRDTLADLSVLEQVCRSLGDRATLHVVEGADHSFHVLKRSGRRDDEVLEELGDVMTGWVRTRLDFAR
ncbi:MAG: alpha/beta hydrolase [Gemmatimonadales bacterium]|nr:alpha/beta hydrolase [Gemmatimonadales bacterium]